MRRVELIIKPQNNTESFFVVEKHRIVFFMCSFCWREDWERATIFRFCLGDDSSSIFFLLIFFFFTRKQPFCFRLFYNTLKSNTRENSITKILQYFFLSLWILRIICSFCLDIIHSLIPFCFFVWKTRWFLKMRRKLKQSHSKFQQRN